FNHVQVNFHDTSLGPGQIDREGEGYFHAFSQDATARPKIKISSHLHRDRAGAPQSAPVLIIFESLPNCGEIDAAVKTQPIILGGIDGIGEIAIDLRQSCLAMVPPFALRQTYEHQGRRRWVEEAIDDEANDPIPAHGDEKIAGAAKDA